MIHTEPLELFAEVSIALASVSGIVLIFGRQSAGVLTALDRARLKVLFQLTFGAFILAVIPMVILAGDIDSAMNLRASSASMCVLIIAVMVVARLTYSKVPDDESAEVPGFLRAVFYGALALQLALSSVMSAGYFQSLAMSAYLAGLTVMLALAFLQFFRFFSSERTKAGDA